MAEKTTSSAISIPIFAALAPGIDAAPRTDGREKLGGTSEQGYLHCGSNGAGHFVKMVHNGIEYGLMAAYAEGLNILRGADIGMRSRDTNAETTPLADPEFYQYDPESPRYRRGLAAGQRDSLVASRSHRQLACCRVQISPVTSVVCPILARGAGRLPAAIDEAFRRRC